MADDIEIEIDGRKLTANPGQTVIQVADEAGIYIPRFCYHKHLSIPANCRMCLVEMEKSPKAVPACATPVMPGMKIFTKSQKTILAQRAVMEFLLINHPLDCPVCDQGGECELQDLSMGYGATTSPFDECKRAVEDEDLGPLIATEMTRCILCTRCIRFGDEVAGMPELGMTYRGGIEEVASFVGHAVRSEVSGNIIDLCPVGALTSKPYRFTARPWELNQFPGVSPHDCLGSNLHVHTRNGKVMRVVARENTAINQTWISDRDRFAYTGLYHEDRVTKPLLKKFDSWQEVEWAEALEVAAQKLQDTVAKQGAKQIAALASPNSTVEEFYLLQKLMRGLGSNNIDHRLRECDMQDQQAMPAFPSLGITLAELEQCDSILIIGSNLQKEQPVAALRVRKAAQQGAAVSVINSVDYDFNFNVQAKKIVAPQELIKTLQEMIDTFSSDSANALVQQLHGKKKPFILLGAMAFNHTHAAQIRSLAHTLATLAGSRIGCMTNGANGSGAWLAGAIPHRQAAGEIVSEPGLNAYEMLQQPRQGYVLLNVEPDLDCANANLATHALRNASCVIAISQFRSPLLEEVADVILPMGAFTESSGTYVNASGEWQSVLGVSEPAGEARPAWKILRVLGNFLQLEGFAYESSEEIKHEVHEQFAHMQPVNYSGSDIKFSATDKVKLSRIGEVPIYAVDSLTRHAKPLQAAQIIMEGEAVIAKMHPNTAAHHSLNEGDEVIVRQANNSLALPVKIDARIAENAVWVAGGIAATRELGDLFGEIALEKI